MRWNPNLTGRNFKCESFALATGAWLNGQIHIAWDFVIVGDFELFNLAFGSGGGDEGTEEEDHVLLRKHVST